MESRLKKSHRLIRLISDIKSAPYLTVAQLLASHGISRAQFYKDKTALAELGFEFTWDRPHRRFRVTRDAYFPIENLSLSEHLNIGTLPLLNFFLIFGATSLAWQYLSAKFIFQFRKKVFASQRTPG